ISQCTLRVYCARFAFSNTSRNPSFRNSIDKHQSLKSTNMHLSASTTDPNPALLTFVLILICIMLGLIIVFTVVHCAIFCGLTISKLRKTMKNSVRQNEGRLPYFVLSDYSETAP
ncbi:hypothetical protein PFISCL1PPCAC_28302, partial [Pristionchus fissidentatus]